MKSSILELQCGDSITYGQYVGERAQREEVGWVEVRRVGKCGGKKAIY
jgi:hypothetical protein